LSAALQFWAALLAKLPTLFCMSDVTLPNESLASPTLIPDGVPYARRTYTR